MTNTIGLAELLTKISLLAALAVTAPAMAVEMPPLPTEFPPQEVIATPQEEYTSGPPDMVEGYTRHQTLGEALNVDSLALCNNCPAPLESTGTWFRRGWWSTEIDAVVMVRNWDRSNEATLAGDSASTRTLGLKHSTASEGSARLNLGRFLFRDIENRDHTMEFTVFGGNEFQQECHLDANVPNNLVVSSLRDGFSDQTFTGASEMDIAYASRLSSFEWNYKVTSRMKTDRMELQPSGEWIRRASPGFTYFGIAGMRYTDLTETTTWTAEDIINVATTATFTGENGLYRTGADNDMFGFQGGGGLTYEADRWSLTFFTKGGIMMNDAKTTAFLEYTDPVTGEARDDVGFSNSARDGSLPLLLQGGMMVRYHLRPNMSLRAGYEFLYLTDLALAPHQMDFVPDDRKVTATASPFYHGITMGTEIYW